MYKNIWIKFIIQQLKPSAYIFYVFNNLETIFYFEKRTAAETSYLEETTNSLHPLIINCVKFKWNYNVSLFLAHFKQICTVQDSKIHKIFHEKVTPAEKATT